jgi:hypothetical protein
LYLYYLCELLIFLVLFSAAFLLLALIIVAVILLWWATEWMASNARPALRKTIAFSRRLIARYPRPGAEDKAPVKLRDF